MSKGWVRIYVEISILAVQNCLSARVGDSGGDQRPNPARGACAGYPRAWHPGGRPDHPGRRTQHPGHRPQHAGGRSYPDANGAADHRHCSGAWPVQRVHHSHG